MTYIEAADLPDPLPPHVGCNFNAFSQSDEVEDDCFYEFDEKRLESLSPKAGLEVLLFAAEDEMGDIILARVAHLEPYHGGWRARPTGGWYCGAELW